MSVLQLFVTEYANLGGVSVGAAQILQKLFSGYAIYHTKVIDRFRHIWYHKENIRRNGWIAHPHSVHFDRMRGYFFLKGDFPWI